MKPCTRCKQLKPLSDFSLRSDTGKRQSHCKACMAWKTREWGRKNPIRLRMANATKYQTAKFRASALLHAAKKRADKKGLEFSLTHAWVVERIAAGFCEATGIPFILDAGKGHHQPFAPSLDRKDNARGYTEDNVQVVAFIHNAARGPWGDGPLLTYARALVADAWREDVAA